MPIQVFSPSGVKVFDTNNVLAGICLGGFYIPAGATLSKSFPLLAGCTVRAFQSWAIGEETIRSPNAGISYASGFPQVSISAESFARLITLWATGAPTASSIPGIQASSSLGTVALSPHGRGLNFIGIAAKHRDDPSNTPYSSGTDPIADPNIQYYRINSPTRPQFVMRLYQKCIVVVRKAPFEVSPGVWEIAASRLMSPDDPPESTYRRWWSYDTEIYCFAQPSAPQSNPTFYTTDVDGSLAYDLARPGLLGASHFITAPSVGANNTLADPPAVMGVIGTPPYHEFKAIVGLDPEGIEVYDTYLYSAGWSLHGAVVRKEKYVTFYNLGGGAPGSTDNNIDYPSYAAVINLSGLS